MTGIEITDSDTTPNKGKPQSMEPQETMQPDQALEILSQSTANMSGTRAQHDQIKEAIHVIQELIRKNKTLSIRLSELDAPTTHK